MKQKRSIFRTYQRCVAFVLSMAMVLSLLGTNVNYVQAAAESCITSFDVDAQTLVDDMGVGWNLGNSLDSAMAATADETYWGNPKITKEMIETVKAAGFKTIRIPTTWTYKLGAAPDYTVDEAWMNRVEEVVQYAIDCDMYVILNTHHECANIVPTYEKQEETIALIGKLWTQIAERFKDYGGNVIFETLNEPRVEGGENEWNGATAEVRDVVNTYNQAAVDAIRATGGNNARRKIMIPAVAASPWASSLDDFKIPENDDNIIVSAHAYSPYDFAMQYPEGTSTWSETRNSEITYIMQELYNRFVSQGTPVVIGEFGTINKNNLQDRVEHMKFYVSEARSYGISCVLWDNNSHGEGSETFGMLYRDSLTWHYPEIVDGIVQAEASAVSIMAGQNTTTSQTTSEAEGTEQSSESETEAATSQVAASTTQVTGNTDNEDSETSSTATGFVKAEGNKFTLDGSDFYYAGTNNYYINFKPSEDVDAVMKDAQDMGLTVIRTWGHLDVGTKTDEVDEQDNCPVFEGSIDGKGQKEGVYYYYWDADLNQPVVNHGEDGLQKLDYVLYQAEKHNIKMIFTLSNYWSPFGGMEQYAKWAGAKDKEQFYTDEQMRGWFKNYIYEVLNHENVYTGRKLKDEPAIFAWELANEPRYNAQDKTIEENAIYQWASEMSAYIKSIDQNHMVAIGDEGGMYYNEYVDSHPGSNAIPEGSGVNKDRQHWHGGMGNFHQMMQIDTIDFGTPHLYPGVWNIESEKELDAWLKIHAEVAHEADKPVILEEFGWSIREGAPDVEPYAAGRDTYFEYIYNAIEEYDYAGSNFWMIGSHTKNDAEGYYPDYDGFTVYNFEGPVSIDGVDRYGTNEIIIEHAKVMNSKGDKNKLSKDSLVYDKANPASCEVTVTPQTGAVITAVAMDGKEIAEGTAYDLEDNKITFNSDYLNALEETTYYLTVTLTKGMALNFSLEIKDSSIVSAVVADGPYPFDKNVNISKDVTIPVTANDGGACKGVYIVEKNSKTALAADAYTVTDNSIVIKANYLKDKETGDINVILDYTKGSDPIVTITIVDTTGKDIIDNFESYADETELNAAWSRNTGGGTVTATLVTGQSDSTAMNYAFSADPGYAGITKKASDLAITSFDGVSFWIKAENTDQNDLTIQFCEQANNRNIYWEKIYKWSELNAENGALIKIPFTEFAPKSGEDTGSVLGENSVADFSLYVGGQNRTNSFVIDDIMLYSEGGSDITQVDVESVSLSQDALTVEQGKTATLTAKVLPETATFKSVRWESEDTSVATVVNGVVTGVKAGTTTITCVSSVDSTKKAICQVTVTPKMTDSDVNVSEQNPSESTTQSTSDSGDIQDTEENAGTNSEASTERNENATTQSGIVTEETELTTAGVPGVTEQNPGVSTEENEGTTAGVPNASTQNPGVSTEENEGTTAGVPGVTEQNPGVSTEENEGTTAGVPNASTQNPADSTEGSEVTTAGIPNASTQNPGDSTGESEVTTAGVPDVTEQNPGGSTGGSEGTTAGVPDVTEQNPGGSTGGSEVTTAGVPDVTEQNPGGSTGGSEGTTAGAPDVTEQNPGGSTGGSEVTTAGVPDVTEQNPGGSTGGIEVTTAGVPDVTEQNPGGSSGGSEVTTAGVPDVTEQNPGGSTGESEVTTAGVPDVTEQNPGGSTGGSEVTTAGVPDVTEQNPGGSTGGSEVTTAGVPDVTEQNPGDAMQGTTAGIPNATTQANQATTQAPAAQEKTVTGINLITNSNITLKPNTAQVIYTQVIPADAAQSLTYTSLDEGIATVTPAGMVRAVAPGITYIMVKASDSVQMAVKIKVIPLRVTKLKKKSAKATSVKLTWKKQTGVSGYKIYKYNAKTKKYKLCKKTAKNSITITKLKKAATYKFKVRAFKKSNNNTIYGAYSKVLKVKLK